MWPVPSDPPLICSLQEFAMNVFDYLLEQQPESAPALLTLSAEYSYGEVKAASESVADFLFASGGKKGERVLLLAENGLFWVAAYLGAIRAGMVCVPLPTKIAAADLEYILSATEPRLIFAEPRVANLLPESSKSVPLVTEIPPTGASGDKAIPTVSEDDLAALMFTSGSTGRPRGVMISHGNIIANTDSIIQCLSLTALDRIMAVLPFHYCFGTSLLHTHLRVGGSLVIDSRFMYPEAVLQRMHETRCTGFAGVPSHYQILLRKSNLGRMTFPHLRYVQQAGGQLAPAFIQALRDALPTKRIFVMYGQTEATARLSYLPPDELDRKLGSVGKGMPGVQLSVLAEDGLPVAPQQTGEIVAQGGNIARGYWRDQEETARSFRDGKLYTGDLATVDEDGFIYIVDRAKDFLKCGGKRVSCRHLENVLLEYDELIEAAVVGIPDEVLGEAALAYVVPRNPKAQPTPEQLDTHCRSRLPLSFVPKQFVVLSSLPKNSSGKVLKPLLKTQALAALQN